MYLTNADVAVLYGQPFGTLTVVQRALSDEWITARPVCSCHRPLAAPSPILAGVIAVRLTLEDQR